MVALNFQERFGDDVESGRKPHTVRLVRKHPIKVGDKLQLYVGMRTKRCRKLADAVCVKIEPIYVNRANDGRLLVKISDQYLSIIDQDSFAVRDGFYDMRGMVTWLDKTHGLPFRGVVIHWRLLGKAAA